MKELIMLIYYNLKIQQKSLKREGLKEQKELKVLHKSIDDKFTKIKLAETVSVLNKTKLGKTVSDNHVSSLMISYELIKELKGKLNGK